ncbi:uncharacterized protein [Argopecten irradians]|uniref:uncharacterized protein n=1 Tax=Argopecten irradians TaxID=31199 RepID=UPI00371953D9
MMLRLIIVTCMTSSVLALPLHNIFRRSLVKRFGNENYGNMVNYLVHQMLTAQGESSLTEIDTERQLLNIGINSDTAKTLAGNFFECCDRNFDDRLNTQELRRAMFVYNVMVYP